MWVQEAYTPDHGSGPAIWYRVEENRAVQSFGKLTAEANNVETYAIEGRRPMMLKAIPNVYAAQVKSLHRRN